MTRCFAHLSASGPGRAGRYPFAIGVLEASDEFTPIGMVSAINRTEDGLALGVTDD
jgi:hypothetical protein